MPLPWPVRLGGVDNHHAGGGLDARKAATDIEGPANLGKLGGKRVVAAGIEEHEIHPLLVGLHDRQDLVDIDRFDLEIGRGFEFCVDGDGVVAAGDLQAVPREEEQRHLGAA